MSASELPRNATTNNPEVSPDTTNDIESEVGVSLEEKQDMENKSAVNITDIPDGGYGWLIVLACFLLNFNTWGANSGFAIYLSYYLNHGVFKGADKYDYALIGGMTFGVGLAFSPLINYIQGKIGLRATIILGNVAQFAALMMASFSKKLWQLYLTQGLLQAFGLAFITLPAISILPQWFKKRRTLASAISAAGSGCGGVVYNLGMQKVLETYSVFWALRAQSIICFGLIWISICLLKTRMDLKFTIYDSGTLQSAGFWIFSFYLVFCMFGYVVVLYDMANFTTSLGYTAYQGSIASAMVQVGSVFGRPIVGQLSDKLGVVNVAFLAYSLCSVFVLAMWIPARNYATVIVFCLIIGSIMGSVFATTAPILSRLVGLRKVGVALCMSWVFLGMAGIASPVIGLSLKTGNHGYVDASQYLHCSVFAGVSFACCALSLLLMRGYLIARDNVADTDADQGHLHITVPFLAPFENCLVMRNI